MENTIVYVKLFSKSGQIIEKPYLSNIEVKENDLVYVEGIELPVYVSKVINIDSEVSFDVNSLHKVIKLSLDDKNSYMDNDIANIDFLNIFNIELKYKIKDYFSYTDYHADSLYFFNNKTKSRLSFFEELGISNKENREFFNMSLEFKFDNDIFKASPILFNKIYGGESKNLELPFINVDYEKLIKLNEIIISHLEMTLKSEGKILKRIDHTFKILPISQPSINVLSDERLYLKYITPNSNKVKEFCINIPRDNGQAFIGYQNEDINDRYKEIKDIYNYIHNYGITYFNPPKGGVYVDDLGSQQRLRLPDDVLKDKSGTCIDLALCFSSIYENIGYNTVLVLTDTHAYMGVFLKNKDEIKKDIFTSGVITSESVLYNYITSGANDLILIDTVYATRDKNYSLDEVIDITVNNLKENKAGFKCFNVNFFHNDNGMYRSIPTSNEEYELFSSLKSLKIVETQNKVFENITYNDILEEPIKDRFTFWENKLLDLDEANPLVNFKISTSNTIRICSDSNILDLLEKDSKLKILGMNMPDNKKLYECLCQSDKPEAYLYSADKDKIYGFGLDSTFRNIIKKSKEAQDETGAPTLYLILGTLKFTRENKEKAIAPFMVLPIKVTKNKISSSYEINYDFDDLMLNKTFFEYYKLNNPDFNFDYLYNLNSDIKYQDIVHKFKLENRYDISLDSEHFLITNLTFSHYIMWLDIVKRKEELKKNKIIDSIISNTNKLNEPDLLFDSDKDELEDYNNFSAPLPYDSTQLKAVMDSAQGRSFILDGPPGTGKSQTIVNMMVNAIRLGKSVLFVAEKKAALDVVYKRLENIKLDRFALELHSNKANKSDFFKKLGQSMELGETVKPNDYEAKLQELKIKKLELLNIINKIHKNKFYFSLYECIEIYLNNNSKIYNLDNNLIYNYDDDKHKEIIDLLNELYDISYQITDFDSSLIKLIGSSNISYYDKDKLRTDFINLNEAFDNAYYDINDYIKNIGIDTTLSLNDIKNILRIIDNTFNLDIYNDKLDNYNRIDNLDEINNVFDKIKELNTFKSNHNYYNYDMLNNINTKERIIELNENLSFFKRLSRDKKIKAELSTLINNKINDDFIKYYQEIEEYNNIVNYINLNIIKLDPYCDKFEYKEIDNVIIKFNDSLKYVESINKINNILSFKESIQIFDEIRNNNSLIEEFKTIKDNVIKYQNIENEVTSKYKIRYKLLNLDKYIELMNNQYPFSDYINMASINKILNRLDELNLSNFTSMILNNEIKVSEIKDIYLKSLSSAFIEEYFKDSDINYFNPKRLERDIEQYRDLINQYSSLSIEEISYVKSSNLIHGNINYKDSTPLGRLKKSIQNSGRGVTIRDTLLSYDNIIRSYFPIFLMSPLSVAQYLSLDDEYGRRTQKFDIVIFDEASQIPTHEAIGAICRGKSLIVAGDPMQMPPSSYFRSNIEISDDDIEYVDAESLLDECLAIGLPRIQLKFHYRSHHESLIDYSNKTYYNNSLYTFPSSDASEFKINYKHINLNDSKSDSSLSKEETEEIINTIKDIYKDENNKGKTLGIIVFNTGQKDKLEESLNNYLLKDKTLSKELSSGEEKGEPFFIKSLENVQGDERDIIILSIGFKVAGGHPYINGPLTRINGEKRLNVAISRSKEAMYVISTIKYSDFRSDEFINSKGVRDLKHFLNYAETRGFVSNINSSEALGINELIAKDLNALGLETLTNVGNSNIKVDIAVKDPKSKEFNLGIMIDLSVNSTDLSLRDRLFVNEYMLNNLKWKIINIYSLEYFKDRNLTIKRILEALDAPYIKEKFELNPNIIKEEEDKTIPVFKKKMYLEAKLDNPIEYDKDNDTLYGIDDALKNIIETESPVSFDRIKLIIRNNSNIKVINKSISESISLSLQDFKRTEDQNESIVYWNKDDNYMDYFRYDTPLDIYQIPKEEILSCMKQIIDIQGDISLDDLYKELIKEFNFKSKTLTSRIKTRLDYCYKYGKDNNII